MCELDDQGTIRVRVDDIKQTGACGSCAGYSGRQSARNVGVDSALKSNARNSKLDTGWMRNHGNDVGHIYPLIQYSVALMVSSQPSSTQPTGLVRRGHDLSSSYSPGHIVFYAQRKLYGVFARYLRLWV
jgi:hypothetical protein